MLVFAAAKALACASKVRWRAESATAGAALSASAARVVSSSAGRRSGETSISRPSGWGGGGGNPGWGGVGGGGRGTGGGDRTSTSVEHEMRSSVKDLVGGEAPLARVFQQRGHRKVAVQRGLAGLGLQEVDEHEVGLL